MDAGKLESRKIPTSQPAVLTPSPRLWSRQHCLHAVNPVDRLLQPLQSGHLVLVLLLQELHPRFKPRPGFSLLCDHLVCLAEQLHAQLLNLAVHSACLLFSLCPQCPLLFQLFQELRVGRWGRRVGADWLYRRVRRASSQEGEAGLSRTCGRVRCGRPRFFI